MVRLVFRQFLWERTRTALTVLVVGAVIGVVLLLGGLEQGLYTQVRQMVLNRGGDLVVTQAGVSNMTMARSVLPQYVRSKVEAVPGVAIAHPLTQVQVIYSKDGRRTAVFLMVYDTAGGPITLSAGKPISDSRDIVIHQSLADRYGLAPGDDFVLSDYAFHISGVDPDSAAIFTPFAYVTYDGLIDYYFEADLAGDIATFPLLSFLLVDLQPGADRDAVAAAIRKKLSIVNVYTPEELAGNDANLVRVLFGPVMGLLVGVSYAIGVLIVGIFMFASVGRRLRQFGVMKALGFRTRDLLLSVSLEAGVVTLLAVPVAIGLAAGLAAAIQRLAPLYVVLPLEPVPLTRTLVAATVFAALGALTPVRMVSRTDPAEAFRS